MTTSAGCRNAVVGALQGLYEAQPTLPAWLFYDERGSELFEQITELPEYYLTRAERWILETFADDIVARAAEGTTRPLHVVELGAGSAKKSQILLDAVVRRQGRALFVPVDVSGTALDGAVERLAREAPRVEVRPVRSNHLAALPTIRSMGPRRLVLFLGSSIGNYEDDEAVALLSAVSRVLLPGAALLLGTDRRKSPEVLLPAYDDAAGVTAAFNLNVLTRLNRDYGTDFVVDAWRHEARWNEGQSRVEMHLVAREDQDVRVPAGPSVPFGAGSSIHTESSHKYDRAQVERLLSASGFVREHTFTDDQERFDLHLARLADPS